MSLVVWCKVTEGATNCPVAEDAVVEVVYRNKQTSYQPMTACCFNWNPTGSDWDIEMYHVLKSGN